MREKALKARIQVALSKFARVVTWCNNRGTGWLGFFVRKLNDGSIVLGPGAHRNQFGLEEGASDLIGHKSIIVEQKHVGMKIAVPVYIEVKVPGKVLTKDQLHFIKTVQDAGALAGMADSVESALEIVERL